jgi:hypothetical protein
MLHGVRIGVESDLSLGVAQPFADDGGSGTLLHRIIEALKCPSE